jgi:hypothetical protein
MKSVRVLLRESGQEAVRTLKRECRRQWVETAEQVGRFTHGFEWLRGVRDGFDPAQRYILERSFSGDLQAIDLRDSIIKGERWLWMNEAPPEQWESDLRTSYFSANESEFFKFRSENYPWTSVLPELATDLLEPYPDFEVILESYVLAHTRSLGFEKRRVRSSQQSWKVSTTIEGRTVVIEFEKGSIHPSTKMMGLIRVPDFDFGISVAHPLFFSGGPQFLFSKSHPYVLQLDRFFEVFEKLLPTYAKLIDSTIKAGNDYFATITRKSS